MEKILSWVIFFCLIAYINIFTEAQTNAVNLIDFTCKQTPDYNLCVSTLKSDPRTPSAKDVKALATILVDQVHRKAILTQGHTRALSKDPIFDSKTKEFLTRCTIRYGHILNWIVSAKLSMAANDYSKAQDYIKALPTHIELCEREFESLAHVKSPITDVSKAMDDIAKVAVAVVTYKYMHPAPPMN
ncbi:cell wall / vacuolar inhibitor of fructosidase 1-like [Silene latifolia]|uniref:cell wall / vacuolar inhibitor of fructosidase 1-like n=1 Tax=Silene latifolia TaxID=37657 RepID=UPI003D76F071